MNAKTKKKVQKNVRCETRRKKLSDQQSVKKGLRPYQAQTYSHIRGRLKGYKKKAPDEG